MPNNLWSMETYRQLREDNVYEAIREAKVMADIYINKSHKHD